MKKVPTMTAAEEREFAEKLKMEKPNWFNLAEVRDLLQIIAEAKAQVTISIIPKDYYGEDPVTEFAEVDISGENSGTVAQEGSDPSPVLATGHLVGFGSPVRLSKSGEKGEVIGIAEYSRHPKQFQIEYVAADGRQVSDWFYRESFEYGHSEAEANSNEHGSMIGKLRLSLQGLQARSKDGYSGRIESIHYNDEDQICATIRGPYGFRHFYLSEITITE